MSGTCSFCLVVATITFTTASLAQNQAPPPIDSPAVCFRRREHAIERWRSKSRGWILELSARKFGSFSTAFLAVTLAIIVSGLSAQIVEPSHHRVGIPQDWSLRHIVFQRNTLLQHPELARLEPRVLHQGLRRNVSSVGSSQPDQRDWNFPLGAGHINTGMSPAKFGFDTLAAPSCSDYVVFALNVAGSATQANLVALNHLYTGMGCGTVPSVLFSYNVSTVGGRLATSPIISLDGTKIGVVETTNASAVFHILTWQAGPGNGTSATAPAVPGAGNGASMVSIAFGGANRSTRSSPWIDYNTDIVYVGNNNGRLNKFTGVFKGTPTLVIAAPWPVVASGGRNLTGPVFGPGDGKPVHGRWGVPGVRQCDIGCGDEVGSGLAGFENASRRRYPDRRFRERHGLRRVSQ